MTDLTSDALDKAKTQVSEAIGAALRKYCDSVHAKRARDNLHAMPPHEWCTFVTMIAEAAAVPYITAHAERAALREEVRRLAARVQELEQIAADVVLAGVIHPEYEQFEVVDRRVMDRLRMMIDHEDIARAAARARAALAERPDDQEVEG